MLTRDTERAETVEDGGLEATDLAELGVDVERVAVAVETVEGGLVLRGLLLDDDVGLALRRLVGGDGTLGAGGSGLGRATEATAATDEDGRLIVEEVLACGSVLGCVTGNDESGGALVDHVDELGVGLSAGIGGDGELADLHVLFTVEKHHWGEVLDDVAHVPGGGGVEPRDNTECGEGLEVVVVLVDEGKVGALGAQAQVVEDNIALSVVERGSVGSSLLSLLDGGQNVVTTAAVATVVEVFHHLLVGGLDIVGVVCTAVIEVGDLSKLLDNSLRCQLDVNREAVATAALPASAAEPTATTLEQTLGGVGLGANVGAEKNHQRRNVVGLEGLDHLLGHD